MRWFILALLVVNTCSIAALAWRAEHREQRVTIRTEAFEGVVLMAMERAYDAGAQTCKFDQPVNF